MVVVVVFVVASDRFLDAFFTVLLIGNGIDANPEHKQNEMEREKKNVLNNERKLTYMRKREKDEREIIRIYILYPFRIDAAFSADERFSFEIIYYYY